MNWDVVTAVNFISNNEKYYYIPEIFTSSYSNITGNLSVQKNFYLRNIHLAPALNTSYTSNLSNSMLLSTLNEITKTQRKEIYQQELDYYSSDLIKAGAEIKCGKNLDKRKKNNQIYISLRFDYCKQLSGDLYFNMIGAKLGFIF
jgi:hypothetical protein